MQHIYTPRPITSQLKYFISTQYNLKKVERAALSGGSSGKGLVTKYGEGGGLQNVRGGGGAREVLPLRKGGAEKVLAMLKGGGAKQVLG